MFKCAAVSDREGLQEAEDIMGRIYKEDPKHWPYGLTAGHFDGGLYLVREKRSNTPVGFVGWQERHKCTDLGSRGHSKEAGSTDPQYDQFCRSLGIGHKRVGYYSVGILPEYRNNGYAKEALARLLSEKAAGVDEVQALIVEGNNPSIALADSLGVPAQIKRAVVRLIGQAF